mmetsp:Transcript_93832/g.251085  ORF Transcript_93832/g.251085 Transcript_93832/m.251085 type:complete len:203 (-) Transcript_93832:2884-3492(-)
MSIHSSRSRIISNGDRSFLVFNVPPIICIKARAPESFSRSLRMRSSSAALRASNLSFSSGLIHFSALISSSRTVSTDFGFSNSYLGGETTASVILSSPKIDRSFLFRSSMASTQCDFSFIIALNRTLNLARYSWANSCNKTTCTRRLQLVSSSNGSYRRRRTLPSISFSIFAAAAAASAASSSPFAFSALLCAARLENQLTM